MNDENHLQLQCFREDLLDLQTLNKHPDAFHHPVKAKTYQYLIVLREMFRVRLRPLADLKFNEFIARCLTSGASRFSQVHEVVRKINLGTNYRRLPIWYAMVLLQSKQLFT